MALIKPDWIGPHGIAHEEAYVCVHLYQVNIMNSSAKVLMHFYSSNEEKDNKFNPVHKEWWKVRGSIFEKIFTDNPEGPEDTILTGIYENIINPEETDNEIYHDMEPVYEKMKQDHDGGEHGVSYAVHEEISRKKAERADLVENVDFESVADIA